MKKKKAIEAPLLIDIVAKNLTKNGYFCIVDKFTDDSSSWIQVYKEDPAINKNAEQQYFELSFNGAGTEMEDIRLYEETFQLISQGTKKLF